MRNQKLREKIPDRKKIMREKKIKKKKFKILNIKQFFPASYEDSLVVRAVCWTTKNKEIIMFIVTTFCRLNHLSDDENNHQLQPYIVTQTRGCEISM